MATAATSRSVTRLLRLRAGASDIEDQIKNQDDQSHSEPLHRISAMALDAQGGQLPIANQTIRQLVVLLNDDRLQIDAKMLAITVDRQVLPQVAGLHLRRELEQRRISRRRNARDLHLARRRCYGRQALAIRPCGHPATLDENIPIASREPQRTND